MSIRLMSQVWDATSFRGLELLVMLALADHSNDQGVCWPSHERIAKRCRCSRRQVVRVIQRLEQEGWLTVSRRINEGGLKASSVYQLNVRCEVVSHQGPDVTSEPLRCDKNRPYDVTSRCDIAVSHKPSGEPSKNHQKEPSARPKGRAPVSPPRYEELLDYALQQSELDENLLSKPISDLVKKIEAAGSCGDWRSQVDGLLAVLGNQAL